jgi:predicted CoA-binding protein
MCRAAGLEHLQVIHCPSFHTLRPFRFAIGAFFCQHVWNGQGMRMDEQYSDDQLRTLLKTTSSVAVVGVSANPVRPSYFVARYLKLKGFDVYPVNPAYVGQNLFGRPVVAELQDISAPIDMVDIFRRSDAVPAIVDAALDACPSLNAIWMQIGVSHADAAETARARGVTVVQNRCPKIEYQRLFGELRMGGFNTGIISSKL